jgi:hypothetical protein
MFQLPPYVKGILVGLILSDAWLQFASLTNKTPARLGFKQGILNFPYFWYVFSLFSKTIYTSGYVKAARPSVYTGRRYTSVPRTGAKNNQLRRYYSGTNKAVGYSLLNIHKLHPWFLTGFAAAGV